MLNIECVALAYARGFCTVILTSIKARTLALGERLAN